MGFVIKQLMRESLILSCALALGCAGLPCVAAHHPNNIYRASAKLPQNIRRVAVLPVTMAEDDLTTEMGRDDLERVLYGELRKANAFEVVRVSREQLRDLTGKTEWTTEENLPQGFFARLRETTGCDAVMFCEMSHYRPYAPLSIGWDIRLVNADRSQVVWAVDEVFEAGEPATAAAARGYWAAHLQTPEPLDSWSMQASPVRFAQYTADAVFATLPSR